MARGIVTLYGLYVIMAVSVTANRGFQPALMAPTMHSLRSNASNLREKRWIAHEFGTGNSDSHLWEKGEVHYAIDTDDNDVHDHYVRRIEAGMVLWRTCLPDNFKWTRHERDWCNFNRGRCLMVRPNDEGHHETSLGIPAVDIMNSIFGPFMTIDGGEGAGHVPPGWQAGAIFAHEMGHAWGLDHEHQNPKFWSKKYNGGRYDGTIFTDATFDCTAIPGYAAARYEAINGNHREDLEKMCTDHTIASNYASKNKGGFMGNQYLPLPNKYTLPSDQGGTGIDWDSIMIYTTDQNPPGILRRPGGEKIVPKNAPSDRDCDGLKTLYGGGRQGTDANFLSEPNNAKNADFQRIACSD